jgi:hypothetical protein
MIDLLNRIGFKQIAFGGESSGGSGGGSGSGRTDGPDETLVTRGDSYAYDPYEDADLYDAGGYQQEYSGPDYGGNDNNDNNDRDDRQPTPPPPPPPPLHLRLHQLSMTPTKMRAFMVMAATSKSILALITVEAATTLCLMRLCCRKLLIFAASRLLKPIGLEIIRKKQ